MLLKRGLFVLLSDPLGAPLTVGTLGCVAIQRFRRTRSNVDEDDGESDVGGQDHPDAEIDEKEPASENTLDNTDVFLEVARSQVQSKSLTEVLGSVVRNYGNIPSQFASTVPPSGFAGVSLNMMTYSPGSACTENGNDDLSNDYFYPKTNGRRGDPQFPRCKNYIGKYLAESLVSHDLDFLNVVGWCCSLDDILRGDIWMSPDEVKQRQTLLPGNPRMNLLSRYGVLSASSRECLSNDMTGSLGKEFVETVSTSGPENLHLVFDKVKWELKSFTASCADLSSNSDSRPGYHYVAEFKSTSSAPHHPLIGRRVFVVGVRFSDDKNSNDASKIRGTLGKSDFDPAPKNDQGDVMNDQGDVIFFMGDSGREEISNQNIFDQIFKDNSKVKSTSDPFFNEFQQATCCTDLHEFLPVFSERIATNLESITTGQTVMTIEIDPKELFGSTESVLSRESVTDYYMGAVRLLQRSHQFRLRYAGYRFENGGRSWFDGDDDIWNTQMRKPVLAKLRLHKKNEDDSQRKKRLAMELVKARLKAIRGKSEEFRILSGVISKSLQSLGPPKQNKPSEGRATRILNYAKYAVSRNENKDPTIISERDFTQEELEKYMQTSETDEVKKSCVTTIANLPDTITKPSTLADKEYVMGVDDPHPLKYRDCAEKLISIDQLEKAVDKWKNLVTYGFVTDKATLETRNGGTLTFKFETTPDFDAFFVPKFQRCWKIVDDPEEQSSTSQGIATVPADRFSDCVTTLEKIWGKKDEITRSGGRHTNKVTMQLPLAAPTMKFSDMQGVLR